VSVGVHELVEIGVIPFGAQTLFDLSGVLPHSAEGGNLLGQFLRALFGYSATPEAITFAIWLTYIVVVLYLFLRPMGPATSQVVGSSPASSGVGQKGSSESISGTIASIASR
jgi:high-affinity iron transporter